MAKALVLRSERPVPDGDGVSVAFEVTYYGADLPNGPDLSTVVLNIQPDDTDAQLRAKLTAAVRAEATKLGYAVTAGGVRLPAIVRGG